MLLSCYPCFLLPPRLSLGNRTERSLSAWRRRGKVNIQIHIGAGLGQGKVWEVCRTPAATKRGQRLSNRQR